MKSGRMAGFTLAWFLPAELNKCVWGPKELPQCESYWTCLRLRKWEDVTCIDTLNQHQIKLNTLILTHWTDVISTHTHAQKYILDYGAPVLQHTQARIRAAERDFPCSVFAVWIICTSDTDCDKCVQGYSCVLPYWCWGNVLSLFIVSITTHTHEDTSNFTPSIYCSSVILPPVQVNHFWFVCARVCTVYV